MVEEKAGDMIDEAIDNDVAFLVVGDPFGYIHLSHPILVFDFIPNVVS